MANRCTLTGKAAQVGNRVSHANNKSKHRFKPNTHIKRIWHPVRKCYIRMKLTANALRTIDKLGVEKALELIEKN